MYKPYLSTVNNMFLKQVTKDEYENSIQAIVSEITNLLQLNKEQVQTIRTIKDNSIKSLLIERQKEIYKNMKQLSVNITRHCKTVVKKEVSANMKSGFAKPLIISSEMAEFSGWSTEESRSRNDITRLLCTYIKENNLYDTTDKRKITPDDKLSKLLGTTDTITYNYIQGILKTRCFKTPDI